ncbi:MAG TPA: 2-oxoacid:ferredoxin oxidoreductase subunit gamma [Clostridiaceae bacterium]|jgi:2-oxoglutarate ferredoxin oxidoreductase subunit gamma|nr:2-oxoacid:ferredoxin oxidoreductase subunit gamma [Clostridiaceae bacterium]
MFLNEFIIAGFGGQGILSAGRLLAYAGMLEDKEVSFLPSYGPEMRGGTANCMVVISEQEIASPVLNSCSALIVMNNPSLDKFESWVKPGGIIVTDSSMVHRKSKRSDIKVFEIPATQLASERGNKTFSNVYLLGKLIKETGCVKPENFEKALYGILSKKRHYMIPEEMEILKIGMEY